MTTSPDPRPYLRRTAAILLAGFAFVCFLDPPSERPVPLGPRPAAAQILSHCTAAPKPGVNWLRCFFNERDFSGVDLTGAVIRESTFNRAIFKEAVLKGVDAREAKFVSADLTGAVLAEADLKNADFTRTRLTNANLRGADLREARLFRADLSSADLTGARLDGADLFMAVLDNATWTDGRRCAPGSRGLCRR